jgi:hypothetical protein
MSGTGGSGGNAGSGTSGSGGKAGAGGSGGGGEPVGCEDPREPENPDPLQGDSGSFATLEAVCYFVEGNFNTWQCSNLGGRTVSVNGSTPATMCGGTLPAKVDGGYYFSFGASTSTSYTSFFWYTS